MGSQDIFLLIMGIIISSLVNYIVVKIVNNKRDERARREFESSVFPDSEGVDLRRALSYEPADEETRGATPPPLPQSEALPVRSSSREIGAPGLPEQIDDSLLGIESYPRCPVHRCGNKAGQPQMVFYDPARRMYRCHRGHYFFA